MKLQNKVAIVTGGGSGIGRAISVKFAIEGANVIIADIEGEDAAKTAGIIKEITGKDQGLPVTADVTLAETADSLVETAVKKCGGLDILVNNAGISDMASVCDIEDARWREVMAINLDAHFLLCKRAIPVIKKSGGGRVINIASAMGLMAHEMAAAYSVSKAGVVQLTKQMALDYGEDNITVNAICPGIINTQMTGFMLVDDEITDFYKSVTPMRRIGLPEDVANLALFLASEDASFISGAAIPVDGGVIAGTNVLLGPQ